MNKILFIFVLLFLMVFSVLLGIGGKIELDRLFGFSTPEGQSFYVWSKLFAIGAYCVVCMQLISLAFFNLKSRLMHVIVGALIVLLVVGHVLGFILASIFRVGQFNYALLFPLHDGQYYHVGIFFGAVALWMLFFLIASGVLLYRRSEWARSAHSFSPVFLIFVYLHGSHIGSEFNMHPASLVFDSLFVSAMLSWLLLLARRFFSSKANKQPNIEIMGLR